MQFWRITSSEQIWWGMRSWSDGRLLGSQPCTDTPGEKVEARAVATKACDARYLLDDSKRPRNRDSSKNTSTIEILSYL